MVTRSTNTNEGLRLVPGDVRKALNLKPQARFFKPQASGLLLSVLCRVDIDSPAFLIESNHAIDESEQRVVLSHTDVSARPDLGAALADDDIASCDPFATKPLHTAALGVRIPSVAG